MPSDSFRERTFVWASYDRPGVVTAMIQSLLKDWFGPKQIAHRLIPINEAPQILNLATRETLAIVCLNLASENDLVSVCTSLDGLRSSNPSALRVCYLGSSLRIYAPIVVEAGAQIVVSDIPSLQNALLRLLDDVSLSDDGYHPITMGLSNRLPWSEVDGGSA